MNKLQRIYIPTLGRVDTQITYDGMPDWIKDITYIVVQPHEEVAMKERYPNANIKVLPTHIKGICLTREWIINDGGNNFYGMIDDDVTFWKRNVDRSTGKKNADKSNEAFTDTDWDDMIEWVEDKWNKGYTIAGNRAKGLPPNGKDDMEFGKLIQVFWINGNKLHRDKLVWEIPFVEDVHFILQILGMGGKTIVSDRFLYDCEEYGNEGGCQLAGRTAQINLDNMNYLASLYPHIIKMENKFHHKGNGFVNQKHTIYFKKAYNPYYGRVMNTFWD
jgi:hypothetical protein